MSSTLHLFSVVTLKSKEKCESVIISVRPLGWPAGLGKKVNVANTNASKCDKCQTLFELMVVLTA